MVGCLGWCWSRRVGLRVGCGGVVWPGLTLGR